MGQTARLIFGILLLRSGPQDLPAQRGLLFVAVFIYAAVTMANQIVLGTDPLLATMPTAASIFLLAAFTATVLRAGSHPERFLQTFMALLFAGAFIGLLEIAPTATFKPFLEKIAALLGEQSDPAAMRAALQQIDLPPLPVFVLSALFLWRIVVMAHVFKHALEMRMANAFSIALMYPALLFLVAIVLGKS